MAWAAYTALFQEAEEPECLLKITFWFPKLYLNAARISTVIFIRVKFNPYSETPL
jgi:hypothetical protein